MRPAVYWTLRIIVLLLSTLLLFSIIQPSNAKLSRRKKVLDFLKRPAGRLWNTVVALYGVVDIYEREVKNPRLKKMYSSRWLYAYSFRPNHLLDYNGSLSETYKAPNNTSPKLFEWMERDDEMEAKYDRAVKIFEKAANLTYEKMKSHRALNTSAEEVFENFEKNPEAFNMSGLKELMKKTWFILPRDTEYKRVEGKPWIVEPKSLDPGNPNYDPRRLKIKKLWRQKHKSQGQIWRIFKQKKERLKQKKLNSFRATRKAVREARRRYIQWLETPEREYSFDEELICEKHKDKFKDWDSYKKVIHEKMNERRKRRKKKLKELKKIWKKSMPTTIKKTKRSWRGFTRRSKDPYTGTRIIGKKERLEMRKERRRIRHRLKRRWKIGNMTTGTTEIPYTGKQKMKHIDMMLDAVAKELEEEKLERKMKEREEMERLKKLHTYRTVKYYHFHNEDETTKKSLTVETKSNQEKISVTGKREKMLETKENEHPPTLKRKKFSGLKPTKRLVKNNRKKRSVSEINKNKYFKTKTQTNTDENYESSADILDLVENIENSTFSMAFC